MITKKTKQSKTGKRCKVLIEESYALARKLQKKFGIEIGVSNLDCYENEKERKAKRDAYERRKSLEYHGIPADLPQDERKALNKTQLEVLYILENRSRQFYGETKIYNRIIAELVNRSVSTVEKAIKKLEDLKFISCYTVRYFRKGQIYSDRLIRCKRVWFDFQLKVARPNSWRYCRRPEKIVEKVHDTEGRSLKDEIVEPEYTKNIEFLMRNGFYSFDEPRICYDHTVQRDEWQWEDSIKRLGYKRKVLPEFDWVVKPEIEKPPSHLKVGRLWYQVPGLELANVL